MATRTNQTRLRIQTLLAGAILVLCFSALAAITVFVLRAVGDKPAGYQRWRSAAPSASGFDRRLH